MRDWRIIKNIDRNRTIGRAAFAIGRLHAERQGNNVIRIASVSMIQGTVQRKIICASGGVNRQRENGDAIGHANITGRRRRHDDGNAM